MARQSSQGTCFFCNQSFSKRGISKHLKACDQRPKAGSRKKRIFHLSVEGTDLPLYWIHFEILANQSLTTIDRFLRKTWVECCGHLSKFIIQKQTYSADYPYGPDLYDFDTNVRLQSILQPDLKFFYLYDFGTPTDLTLKVISERIGTLQNSPLQVLARNNPPFIPCNSCGTQATSLCVRCMWEGKEAELCDDCAKKHECQEMLPVVNSPRIGMCGYTG